jgi:hypothetical protein
MARKVFFSFHFDRDAWRVSQVRNSDVVTSKYEKTKFLDAADWEQIKRNGDAAIRRWIDSQMEGTSVTVILIGRETSTRSWVTYEITKSWQRGNGLLGVYIHNIKNQYGHIDFQGANPLQNFMVNGNYFDRLSNYVQTYDWTNNSGRQNIDQWIEKSVQDRATQSFTIQIA